jgi:uncharacterized membrane protein
MVAVLLALAAAVSFGGSDYTAGLAARKAGALKVTLAAEVVNTILVFSFVPFASSHVPSVQSAGWGAAAGASGAAGVMALYLGFRYAAFSVASPVSAVAAAGFSVLVGLLSGERPGMLSLAGIVLTVPAIIAVSASAGHQAAGLADGSGAAAPPAGQGDVPGAGGRTWTRSPGRHAIGVMCGLAAGAGFAGFLIGLDRAGSGADLWPVGAADLAAVLTVACIAAVAGQFGVPSAGTRGLCLLTGVIAAMGTVSYFLATHKGLLVVTAVIYSLYPAGTIVLARVLSGERLTAVRITGLVLAAVSVGLIAAGSAR